MTNQKIHDLAGLLLKGQEVTVEGVKVRAVVVPEISTPCSLCKFFGSCTDDMNDVCAALDIYNDNFYKLDPVDYDE